MLEEFTNYYNTFNKEKAIVYKYKHSIRVMEICGMLAKSLNLSEEEIQLCKLIGLLHDYGRFMQWKLYNSYNDLETLDHADYSVELLFDNNEIKKFNAQKKYYNIIYDAIKNHNKYKIDKNVSKESLLYINIIRDADKLDILSEFSNSLLYPENNGNFIHKAVRNNFFKHKSVKTPKNRTTYDLIIVKMAFIFDLNFEYSFKYLNELKITNKIEALDKNVFKEYIEEFKRYMEERTC